MNYGIAMLFLRSGCERERAYMTNHCVSCTWKIHTRSLIVLVLVFMFCSLKNECINLGVKVKVKCTLVQALRLCTGRTGHRGSRGIALVFQDHGTRRGWGINVTPRPLFTPGKDPVPIVQEAGWAPGPVWTGAENFSPPPGFDPRAVQPVASCYTGYATRPTVDTDTAVEQSTTSGESRLFMLGTSSNHGLP